MRSTHSDGRVKEETILISVQRDTSFADEEGERERERYIYIYIYIYTERERERERERKRERGEERERGHRQILNYYPRWCRFFDKIEQLDETR